jgi:hypothetical protein
MPRVALGTGMCNDSSNTERAEFQYNFRSTHQNNEPGIKFAIKKIGTDDIFKAQEEDKDRKWKRYCCTP